VRLPTTRPFSTDETLIQNLMKPCINGYFKREQPSIKITCALEIIIAVVRTSHDSYDA